MTKGQTTIYKITHKTKVAPVKPIMQTMASMNYFDSCMENIANSFK
jgi:hypothetical protein